jgi:hypothetical protein
VKQLECETINTWNINTWNNQNVKQSECETINTWNDQNENEIYSMSFWPFYAHVSSYYLYSSLHKSQY